MQPLIDPKRPKTVNICYKAKERINGRITKSIVTPTIIHIPFFVDGSFPDHLTTFALIG